MSEDERKRLAILDSIMANVPGDVELDHSGSAVHFPNRKQTVIEQVFPQYIAAVCVRARDSYKAAGGKCVL